MGSLCLDRLEKLVPQGLGNVAIETGTCKGHGAAALAKSFPRVITIELGEELHLAAREKLASLGNVECLRGNSAELLPEILRGLPEHAAPFFFLDAHWSGDRTVPWRESKWKGYGLDTAHLGLPGALPSGPEQCPLAGELAAIAEFCRGSAVVLVDDVKNIGRRDAGFPGEDWTHLSREKLVAPLAGRLEEFRELERPAQWFLRLKPRLEDRGRSW
jgi:hypothetical protein